MAKLTAQNIAEYFLSLCSDDCGDNISNLKLQKLVYYAQGFNLAFNGKALFKEDIFAWQHGPVVPSLYRKYSCYGNGAIPVPQIDFSLYSKAVKELLDEIWKVFGQFSAWKLRNMTHEELPWKNTPLNEVISHEIMENYFKGLIVKD